MHVSASRKNIRKSNSTFLTERTLSRFQREGMHNNAIIGQDNSSVLAIVKDNEGRWSFLSSFAPLRHSLLHLPFSDCHVSALGRLLTNASAPTKEDMLKFLPCESSTERPTDEHRSLKTM